LLFGLLATNGRFHQALHPSGKEASNSCALCLFANGQVDLPQAVPIVTAYVGPSFELTPRIESIAMVGLMYLASLSRAPPVLTSFLSVVA